MIIPSIGETTGARLDRCFISLQLCLVAFIAIISHSCDDVETNTIPIAVLNVFPYAGDMTTIFTFDATESSDAEDVVENLSVRWDWDNDGIWDTGFQPEIKTSYRFLTRGMNYVRMELVDSDGLSAILTDSVRVFPIPVFGSMTDPRDGQVYKTVYLENNWWMAESLRYGSVIPSDSSQTDNGTIETYAYKNEIQNLAEYGGLYSWFEAMQYDDTEKGQGVCPPGWHVPSVNEWVKIAPYDLPYLFIIYYYGPGGPGGLNLKYGGYYIFVNELPYGYKYEKLWSSQNLEAEFWTSTHQVDRIEDYTDHVAVQRRNRSINIINAINGSVDWYFDNKGLRVFGDFIHLWGDVHAYERYINHPINSINANSVRCTKNN